MDLTEPSSAFSNLYQPGGLDEEPPPYTPSPDIQHGESTIQHGPSRLRPAQPHVQPQPQPLNPSDFARDFYATGPDDWQVTRSESQSTPSSLLDTPPSISSSNLSSTHESSSAPTTTATPGRPLLLDGKLLVYPRDFVCPKCNNIGYKHADPSDPCKKCWERYAKPFSVRATSVNVEYNIPAPVTSRCTYTRAWIRIRLSTNSATPPAKTGIEPQHKTQPMD
ncbi:hypothetical protein H0H92_011087 [Tricholoma furcatifolium]|nr:hypothetical protein H0H92_011087 [Tricholoma furcatifolium]